MDLKDSYYSLLSKSKISNDKIDQLWKELSEAYSEKFRKYHNLNHLKELFSNFETFKNKIEQKEELQWAIFYHDFIYNIWKKNNEQKSAEKAKEILVHNNYSSEEIERIYNLIICTQSHEAKTNDEAYMVDFDLAILGQSSEIYQEYATQIRKEYSNVPWLLYKKGRKKVLLHFMEKEQIYKTSEFQSSCEKQARTNLQNELATL